jgi:hypothetical protein
VAQQSGPGIAGIDDALDTDDCLNMALPIRVIEPPVGAEDLNGAAFVAAARLVVAVMDTERRRCFGNGGRGLVQGRLVAFNLDDQADVGFFGDLKCFF